ncbi:cobalamin-binding protein [Oxalobacteraceae bacterium OM1]|nr:cobalamin-binding protein [Oxalobacteraceae bacterium OM1]
MRIAAAVFAAGVTASAHATVSVVDDTGRTVTLAQPARHIVSLAPHATELLFAAGAGKHVVGVVEFSDFPAEARRIPSVGSGVALDLERILALKPDLVVGWNSGNAAGQLEKLASLGINVFKTEPHDYATIASSLERLGRLAGTDAEADRAAQAFRSRLQQLRQNYSQRPTVTVFYQIWRSPLMTLNGEHMVSAALRLCGGRNVFADLPQTAPTVTTEAVLKADPDAIVASSGAKDDAFAEWRRFSKMKAVVRGNLLTVDGGLLNRSGPRVLEGTEQLCRELDVARGRK